MGISAAFTAMVSAGIVKDSAEEFAVEYAVGTDTRNALWGNEVDGDVGRLAEDLENLVFRNMIVLELGMRGAHHAWRHPWIL